jgi:hypothetical protein
MVSPLQDIDDETGWPAAMAGRVVWEESGTYAVVTVCQDGVPVGSETVFTSGESYFIFIGYPEDGDRFTVTCSLIDGTPPYPIIVRSGIVYPDDFQFSYPYKCWIHWEHFIWN